MLNPVAVAEILSDANAYLSIGDMDNAVSVIFEGVRASNSKQAQNAIAAMVQTHCLSLWETHKSDDARAFSEGVVKEILKYAGATVEPGFLERYLVALVETGSSPFPGRRLFRQRNLLRIFDTVIRRDRGDVAECGCARGMSMLQLCLAFQAHHPGWQGAGFHVFDSFAGLSAPGQNDAIDWSSRNAESMAAQMLPGHFAVSLETVRRNLHRLFPEVALHAGWIPDLFPRQPERVYRFVHIDVDLYQPTTDSLNYFFPRLNEGGIVMTDDYSWPGARKAFDEFAVRNAVELHTTDTAQAFFVKESPGSSTGDPGAPAGYAKGTN